MQAHLPFLSSLCAIAWRVCICKWNFLGSASAHALHQELGLSYNASSRDPLFLTVSWMPPIKRQSFSQSSHHVPNQGSLGSCPSPPAHPRVCENNCVCSYAFSMTATGFSTARVSIYSFVTMKSSDRSMLLSLIASPISFSTDPQPYPSAASKCR